MKKTLSLMLALLLALAVCAGALAEELAVELIPEAEAPEILEAPEAAEVEESLLLPEDGDELTLAPAEEEAAALSAAEPTLDGEDGEEEEDEEEFEILEGKEYDDHGELVRVYQYFKAKREIRPYYYVIDKYEVLDDSSVSLMEYYYTLGDDGSLVLPATVGKYRLVEIGDNCSIYGDQDTKFVRSLTIPEGVRRIGKGAFDWFQGLKSVSLPKSLVEIGENAFYYCDYLPAITLPAGLKTIGKGAFYSC
ncbi:MAG: leucine-rich repeat domain-containing protein, partial [Clostridia bacterium]|nr:leucine-rich repeat domain-containing protein [Clostridia bacterium]